MRTSSPSFHYEWAGYHYIYTATILLCSRGTCSELNNLAVQLNGAIEDAIEAANEAWGSCRIHDVDTASRYPAGAGHLWCSYEDTSLMKPEKAPSSF
ncbi:hypothetical protein F4824DRAFT_444590 [Ustulina deusta]|nr:hypothetical protein F4824DRAFT_444590 [Ustulina deusta]